MGLKEVAWKVQDYSIQWLQRFPDSIFGAFFLILSVGVLYASMSSFANY